MRLRQELSAASSVGSARTLRQFPMLRISLTFRSTIDCWGRWLCVLLVPHFYRASRLPRSQLFRSSLYVYMRVYMLYLRYTAKIRRSVCTFIRALLWSKPVRQLDYGETSNPQITVTFSRSEPHESLIAHLRLSACVVVGFSVFVCIFQWKQ